MAYGKLTLKIYDFRFRKKTLLSDVEIIAKALIYSATKEFALSAEKNIPVWTGMAKGALLGNVKDFNGRIRKAETFLDIADAPGSIDITNARNIRRASGARIFTKSGRLPRLHGGEIKNKYAGARRAGYILRKTTNILSMSFWHDIVQWRIHENSAWHAIEVGKKAFTAYLNRNVKVAVGKIKLINYMDKRKRTETATGSFTQIDAQGRRVILRDIGTKWGVTSAESYDVS